MKKALLFFVASILFFTVHADEFVVKSFYPDVSDLSATLHPRTDANDELCAIIKIRTDLRNLRFDSNSNIVDDVVIENGEFWLFISPGEKQIIIYKDGFITLKFNIPIPVQSSRVYVMELTNKEKATAATGSMIIETIPAGASVEFEQLPDLKRTTPAQLSNYPAFPYNVTISKSRYKTTDTILVIQPGEEITHKIQLLPLWGDLIISVEPKDADIFIDGVYFGNGAQQLYAAEKGLKTGTHTIMARKAGYYASEKTIDIKRGDNGTIQFLLNQIEGTLQIVAEPEGTAIFLNGNFIGNPPINEELQIGEYHLTLQKEGYLTIEKNVLINENQTTFVNEVLQHTRIVRITSFPSDADIYINGNFAGNTPQKVTVSYGKNNILLKKVHFADHSKSIVVSGDTENFDFTLVPAKYNIMINSSVAGAAVLVEKTPVGSTPVNVSLGHGQYFVTLKKDGYFKKRRFIDVNSDYQSFSFKMSTLNNYRFGPIYGMNSWGGEFSYIKNLAGVTFGLYLPLKEKSKFDITYKNINPFDYYGLYPSYSLGTETNTDSIQVALYLKGQFAFRELPTFAINVGFGLWFQSFSNIYLADQDYESYYTSDIIYKDSYYSVAQDSEIKFSPIIGASLRIFRYLYASADCWFNTRQGTQLLVGGGFCIPFQK